MQQLIQKQFTILSSHHDRPILIDVRHLPKKETMPMIIFCHGFKGFKDWGHFNHIASDFARRGYIFVKFNFSHNGTTVEHPVDFDDLEAFGNNNISTELNDLEDVIDAFLKGNEQTKQMPIDKDKVFLIGHSRGGGVVILKTFEDDRIKGTSAWAPVHNFEDRYSEEELKQWKNEGVLYVENSRTKQNMPLYYQLAEDILNNPERTRIPEALKNLKQPLQVIHGSEDEALDFRKSKDMQQLNPQIDLHIIDGGTHTFGGSHPWKEDSLPSDTKEAVDRTDRFFQELL
ncbi:MAG: alpha/beta hydrolase family protein [Candidatus Cyclobacteriaceae bacterium M2_1C_046]